MYKLKPIRFLFSIDETLSQMKESDGVTRLWKVAMMLLFASILIHGWMGYLGIGSNLILASGRFLTTDVYESSKFWFIIGRIIYGGLFAFFTVIIPVLIFKWTTEISLDRLVSMQLVVLLVLLIERFTWIPLVYSFGLDWYVSPFSFGILASYFTTKLWIIHFFGSISIFQLWIIWFQVKFISTFLALSKKLVWLVIIIIHILIWALITFMQFASPIFISGWFG